MITDWTSISLLIAAGIFFLWFVASAFKAGKVTKAAFVLLCVSVLFGLVALALALHSPYRVSTHEFPPIRL